MLPGSANHNYINTSHRHLASELRNFPGEKQSTCTDIYAARIPYDQIIDLGRLMKTQDVANRISDKCDG